MSNFSKSRRILYAVAIAVFGALVGTGVAWIIIASFANSLPKSEAVSFVAAAVPGVAAGGAVGFMAGLVTARFLLRAPASILVAWEEKLTGRHRARTIYGGVPVLLLALLFPWFEPLAHTVGSTAAAWIVVATFLVFVGLSLLAYNRIPPHLIIPLGLLGWLFTFALALWYFWFGPGAFGKSHV